MNKNDKWLNKLLLFSYFFVMVSFYLPSKWNSIAIIFSGLMSLTKASRLPLMFLMKPPLIFFPLLFILLLTGMVYTTNSSYGWALIERHYSLLFLPFIASSFTLLCKKQQAWILKSFVIITTLSGIYFLSYAIFDYFESGSVYIEGKSGHHVYNKFMHHRLTEPLGMHAVYFALYLSFSFIYLLNNFILSFRSYSTLVKVTYFFLFAFYALMIILLKSALFALALPLAIVILLFLHFRRRIFSKSKYIIGAFSLVAILGAFSFYGLQSKILNFSTDLDLTEQHPGPLKIRLGIWYSSWETIKDNWLLGAGTGDGYDRLIAKYHELDFYIGKKDQFNAHNMYLQYWINNGVFALALYIIILLSFIFYFYKKKNYVGILLIFLFASFSMTEATMLRQAGIVFFVLFSSLLYFKSNQFRTSE